MFAAALLVFREVMEAALVVSIVMAATRGIPLRGRWVATGVLAGIVGAVIVAFFAGKIAESMEGVGQEIFNASVLFAAVVMLAWHAIWMAKHGRELAAQMKSVGGSVTAGARPPSVLLAVVALAVLREGSEIVLFMYGLTAGGSTAGTLAVGSAIGLVGGIALGCALYFGLLTIPMRHFFTVTNWMILLLAAGMASQGAGYLIQADVLPTWGAPVWDTSALLTNDSYVGEALKTLIGYDAQPAGMQVFFYLLTALLIVIGMRLTASKPKPQVTAAA
jgi:high-affinity iron transporter